MLKFLGLHFQLKYRLFLQILTNVRKILTIAMKRPTVLMYQDLTTVCVNLDTLGMPTPAKPWTPQTTVTMLMSALAVEAETTDTPTTATSTPTAPTLSAHSSARVMQILPETGTPLSVQVHT